MAGLMSLHIATASFLDMGFRVGQVTMTQVSLAGFVFYLFFDNL